jgi:hypothetical protein
MCTEQEIRLRLNDLHISITDVLERIDEHAYLDADTTLDHMQADIVGLRQEMFALRSPAQRGCSIAGLRPAVSGAGF